MRFPFLPLTGLLALVGVASLGLMARDEKVRALRLPKQSAVYLSIQVSKVWESEPGKQVLSLLDKDIQRRMFDEDRLGLKPEQIERAEMIALSLQKFEEQGAVILTLQKAIDEKVLRRIIGGDPKTKTIHGQKVYGEGVRAGFLRADGKMLVIGTVTMVEKLLDPETATPTGNLALAVEKGQANHLAGYLDPKE